MEPAADTGKGGGVGGGLTLAVLLVLIKFTILEVIGQHGVTEKGPRATVLYELLQQALLQTNGPLLVHRGPPYMGMARSTNRRTGYSTWG